MVDEKQLELLYLIKKTGNVEGRKKLMKLMFLSEHLDTKTNKLVPDKMIGNEFIVYKYGPFSFEIMDTFTELKSKNLVNEEHLSISLTNGGNELIDKEEKKIPENKRIQLNKIVEKYGNMDGSQLEKLSLDLLGIKKEEKVMYFGNPVSVIIVERT